MLSAFLIDVSINSVWHVLVDQDRVKEHAAELLGAADVEVLRVAALGDPRDNLKRAVLLLDLNRPRAGFGLGFKWLCTGDGEPYLVRGKGLVMSISKDGERLKPARCTIGDVREAVRYRSGLT